MLIKSNIDKRTFGYILNNVDIFLFAIASIIKTLNYGKFINPKGYTLKYISPPVIASTMLVVGISLFITRIKRVKFLFFMDLLISFILFADTIYFLFFKDIISAAAIRNSFLLRDVSSGVISAVRPQFLMFFVDLPIFILIINLSNKNESRNHCSAQRTVSAIITLVLSIGLNTKCYAGLVKEQPRLLNTMSNKIYIAKVLGNQNFHMIDTYKYITMNLGKGNLTHGRKQEIETFFSGRPIVKSRNFSGEGSGKNLIIIQMEALQRFVINRRINDEEITPNLNKFIKKSLYFDNFYYQVAEGNTSDAEFMVNNSLYPAASGAAYYRYSNITYNSLPAKLKEKGYYTAVLHGNAEGFWNRNVMYKSMHFDDFYGESSFDMNELIGMGLSDESFFNQTLAKLDHFKKPFYSFLVTLSSHHPYKADGKFDKFKVGKFESTILGDYLKSIRYADEQLGRYLTGLERKGYLKNSIIVIYGDHNALPKEHDSEIFKFIGVEIKNDISLLQQQKVPFLIHFPEDKYKGINHTLSGQMDVLPTLSNIFDLKETPYFGRDIFNRRERFLIFRNGSFTNGKIAYIASSDSYYDMSSGEIIESGNELIKFRDEAALQLSYSDDILDYNLLHSYSDETIDN